MASYFNLTLDTLAPAGLTVKINGDDIYTTSTAVNLALTLTDLETTGYQMKIWGIDGVANESSASWEAYAASKSITLPSGDGLKTVSVKVRDSVGNETAAASDSITLDTSVPTVTVTGPDRPVISEVVGFNQAIINFMSDIAFVEYKVCVVPATSSTQEAGTLIPITNGSINTSGTSEDEPFEADSNIQVTINGADLGEVTLHGADGAEPDIIKVFVKNAAGTWSNA